MNLNINIYIIIFIKLYLTHSSSSDDSSSDELTINNCDCFIITLTSINPYFDDPNTFCYVYDIQQKHEISQCHYTINNIILSICNNDNINDLHTIYDSIVDFYPTHYHHNINTVSISMYTDNNIAGLLISIHIEHHSLFTLCLKDIHHKQTSNIIMFESNGQICPGNNGLPCISNMPTKTPSLKPTNNPISSPTIECEIENTDIVVLVDKSCGLNINECIIYHQAISQFLYTIKHDNN
eukprot:151942_1